MRLVRVAPCGCVLAIAAANITTPDDAAAKLGGVASMWQERSLEEAVELFVRPCPDKQPR